MKTIKIPEDLHRLLKVKAAEQGRGLQELMEEAIKRYLFSSQEGTQQQEPSRDQRKGKAR